MKFHCILFATAICPRWGSVSTNLLKSLESFYYEQQQFGRWRERQMFDGANFSTRCYDCFKGCCFYKLPIRLPILLILKVIATRKLPKMPNFHRMCVFITNARKIIILRMHIKMACLHHCLLFIVFDSTNMGINVASCCWLCQMRYKALRSNSYEARVRAQIVIIGRYIVKASTCFWWTILCVLCLLCRCIISPFNIFAALFFYISRSQFFFPDNLLLLRSIQTAQSFLLVYGWRSLKCFVYYHLNHGWISAFLIYAETIPLDVLWCVFFFAALHCREHNSVPAFLSKLLSFYEFSSSGDAI